MVSTYKSSACKSSHPTNVLTSVTDPPSFATIWLRLHANMQTGQATDAQRLYDARAAQYDASFHQHFTSHIVQLLAIKPGEHILDLACGTGLISFKAAQLVGTTGHVSAIDISTGMLAEAHVKLSAHNLDNIRFYQHSVTELDSFPELQRCTFDAIACTSALVLLPHPEAALKSWTKYLKPGGRLITDVTHPRTLLPGIVLERVGRALDSPVPSHRVAFQKPEDLAAIMHAAGLVNVKVTRMSQHSSRDGTESLEGFLAGPEEPLAMRTYAVEDAASIFDQQVDTPFGACLAKEPTRSQARELFEHEWAELADENGILTEMDEVFVGVGWKPMS